MPGTTLPSGPAASDIEHLASHIDDPLERLRYLRTATSAPRKRFPRHSLYHLLSLVVLVIPMRSDATVHIRWNKPPKPPIVAQIQPEMPNVWIVELAKDYEVYSNGLRIETRLAVANQATSYRLESWKQSAESGPLRPQPAGIVYHTTESDQLPFEADQTHELKRVG